MCLIHITKSQYLQLQKHSLNTQNLTFISMFFVVSLIQSILNWNLIQSTNQNHKILSHVFLPYFSPLHVLDTKHMSQLTLTQGTRTIMNSITLDDLWTHSLGSDWNPPNQTIDFGTKGFCH